MPYQAQTIDSTIIRCRYQAAGAKVRILTFENAPINGRSPSCHVTNHSCKFFLFQPGFNDVLGAHVDL